MLVVLLADLSDTIKSEIIWAVVAIVFGLLQLWTRKAIVDGAKEATSERKEVKETLVETTEVVNGQLESIAEVCNDTHVLVNDIHGKALKLAAEATRDLADLSGQEGHKRLAERAEDDYQKHVEKQAAMDEQVEKRSE